MVIPLKTMIEAPAVFAAFLNIYLAARASIWWLWIVMDVISLYMYSYKHLYLTTLLYAVFIVLCVMGYREWKARAAR